MRKHAVRATACYSPTMHARLARGLVLGTCLAACSSGAISLGKIGEDGGETADAGTDAAPDGGACAAPRPTRHYTFDGTGAAVVDVLGGAPGRLVGGATLGGTGEATLDGVDDYVELPRDVLDGLDEATVAVWIRRRGGPAYTRVFDFGSRNEASTLGGQTYLAATPSTGQTPSGLALLFSTSGTAGEVLVPSSASLDGALHAVVSVVSRAVFVLYFDGQAVARRAPGASLAGVSVENAWLGRSQYAIDPYLSADYADVRIYSRALGDCEVAAVTSEGPR